MENLEKGNNVKTEEKKILDHIDEVFSLIQERSHDGFTKNNDYRKSKGLEPLNKEEWVMQAIQGLKNNVAEFDSSVEKMRQSKRRIEENLNEREEKIGFFKKHLGKAIDLGASQERMKEFSSDVQEVEEFYDVDKMLDSLNKYQKAVKEREDANEYMKQTLAMLESIIGN